MEHSGGGFRTKMVDKSQRSVIFHALGLPVCAVCRVTLSTKGFFEGLLAPPRGWCVRYHSSTEVCEYVVL